MIAGVCYVAINLITEYRLAKMNNLTIVSCYAFALLVGSLIMRQATMTDDPSYAFPTGVLVLWTAAVGILFLIGDVSYFKAYNLGGTAEFGMSIFALSSAIVFLAKYIAGKEKDLEPVNLIGYVLLFIAIGLIMFKKSK